MRLIDPLDVRLDPGESLVITGSSGSGKTTLLRSLAQLWPFTSGTLRRPQDDTMFLSQLPYMPLGDLRAVVSLSRRGGRIFRRRSDPVRARHRVARASGQPARRGGRLGQGALPRRAAADRVRPCAAGQTEGGVPRRVDLRARRGSGVRAVPRAAHPAAGLHRGQRQPPPHRRTAPRPASGTARRRRVAPRAESTGRPSFSPRAPRRAGRRTSPRRAACRWRSPCRPGRCSTRMRPRRTGQG